MTLLKTIDEAAQPFVPNRIAAMPVDRQRWQAVRSAMLQGLRVGKVNLREGAERCVLRTTQGGGEV